MNDSCSNASKLLAHEHQSTISLWGGGGEGDGCILEGGMSFDFKVKIWTLRLTYAKEGYLKSLRAFQPYAKRDALPLRQTQPTVLLPAERAPHSVPLRP